MARLRKKDGISIKNILEISQRAYKESVDDKSARAGQDVLSAKVRFRRGLEYNRSKKIWEQKSREVRIDFVVRTNPQSYKMPYDPFTKHTYPIIFLIRDFDAGFNSTFKIREGSFFKPRFSKKGDSKQERESVVKYNLTRGIQLQAFFDTHYVFNKLGILFGPCYATYPPRKRNPKEIPFFSKHSYWIVTNVLNRMMSEKYKGKIMNRLSKNPERENN